MVYYSERGLAKYFDYREALAVAQIVKRPLISYFGKINSTECQTMERRIWNNPKIVKRLKEDFVVAAFYVDAQNIYLDQNDQYYSKVLGKKIKTLGDKNADFQIVKFSSSTQPLYFFFDHNGNKLLQECYGYFSNINIFIQLLNDVKEAYKNLKL